MDINSIILFNCPVLILKCFQAPLQIIRSMKLHERQPKYEWSRKMEHYFTFHIFFMFKLKCIIVLIMRSNGNPNKDKQNLMKSMWEIHLIFFYEFQKKCRVHLNGKPFYVIYLRMVESNHGETYLPFVCYNKTCEGNKTKI